MKKVLLIILVITAMLIVLVSCNNDEGLLYIPDDSYHSEDCVASACTCGGSNNYVLRSSGVKDATPPLDKDRMTEYSLNGINYKLVYRFSDRMGLDNYTQDVYAACHPDSDLGNYKEERTFDVWYSRDIGKVIGIYIPLDRGFEKGFCLDRMESTNPTEEELKEFAKEKAIQFVKEYELDFNIAECVLSLEPSSSDCFYIFTKCINCIPTCEYLRVDIAYDGRYLGAQAVNYGIFKSFENSKIDTESIKSYVGDYKSITLYNDYGTLVARVEYEVTYERPPLDTSFINGKPAPNETVTERYTKYIPLVPKEIEKE